MMPYHVYGSTEAQLLCGNLPYMVLGKYGLALIFGDFAILSIYNKMGKTTQYNIGDFSVILMLSYHMSANCHVTYYTNVCAHIHLCGT